MPANGPLHLAIKIFHLKICIFLLLHTGAARFLTTVYTGVNNILISFLFLVSKAHPELYMEVGLNT